MALLFLEGFDKYGGLNTSSATVVAMLTAGEWTSTVGSTLQIAAPLSSTGQAFASGVGSGATITKTLAGNYSRLIGGFRFSSNLVVATGIAFQDGATIQASITINTAGTISVRAGGFSGTALGTSSVNVSANTTHYLEWDLTFANSPTGSWQVWLDGQSIIGPTTGDTTASANAYANTILLGSSGASGLVIFDDFYLFDTTGSTNNAVLLTSPRIETQFPVSDGTVQFAIGAAILGNTIQRGGAPYNATANNIYLRPFIPTTNCTISAVGALPGTSNSSVQLRPVVYSDVSGTPTTLLSSGATVVGITTGVMQTLSLTTPQSLVAGTRYWLGLHNDVAVTSLYAGQDASANGRFGTATFASGAPGTCPATSGGQNACVIFGVVSGAGSNAYAVSQNPPQGNFSYIFDSVVGHEDLFNYPALTAPPVAIYAVAVKGNISKSDAGARTISLRTKSGATDSAGTGGTAIAPGTSYGWATSLFELNPDGSVAWTKTALDAALSGLKVET